MRSGGTPCGSGLVLNCSFICASRTWLATHFSTSHWEWSSQGQTKRVPQAAELQSQSHVETVSRNSPRAVRNHFGLPRAYSKSSKSSRFTGDLAGQQLFQGGDAEAGEETLGVRGTRSPKRRPWVSLTDLGTRAPPPKKNIGDVRIVGPFRASKSETGGCFVRAPCLRCRRETESRKPPF